MILVALLNTSWKPRLNRNSRFRLFLFFVATFGAVSAASVAVAQNVDRPWMNPSLSPEERAELVLKQMTLDEKLALLKVQTSLQTIRRVETRNVSTRRIAVNQHCDR
jgi:beta-glucosidase